MKTAITLRIAPELLVSARRCAEQENRAPTTTPSATPPKVSQPL